MSTKVLALCGGVGGAKLALGLSRLLAGDELVLVVNTGDDFEHLGLPISPDLDTLMYTLAGQNNTELGWGLDNESWQAMDMLRAYGAEDWFQLGDKDIATHLVRKQLLSEGHSLTDATNKLCRGMGVAHRLLPMSDDPVRTIVETPTGELSFQHYFVREKCQPEVTGFRYHGAETARPNSEFIELLQSDNLDAVVICPSNPFVSIGPILQLKAVKSALKSCSAPVVAVTPLVSGKAIKGPAAKMFNELGIESSAVEVAKIYQEIINGFVLDEQDAHDAAVIDDLGMATSVQVTVMKTLEDKIQLAEAVLRFADSIS